MFSPVNDLESESRSVVSDFFNPIDYTVHGIFQVRLLECVAFPFSWGSSQPRDQTQVFHTCRRILDRLSHQESPRILQWVAYPFSRGSSQHRNPTGVSCIAGGFFTNSAIREALNNSEENVNGNWQYYQEKTFNYRPQNWTLIRTYGNTRGSEEECKNYFGVSGMGIWIRRKNTAVDTAVIDYVVWKY